MRWPALLWLPLAALAIIPRAAGETKSWTCDAATRRGRRLRQEDAVVTAIVGGNSTGACAALQLAAVFDGHDGGEAVRTASDTLLLRLLLDGACVGGSWDAEAVSAALQASLAAVDADVLSQGVVGGTTAVATLIDPQTSQLFVAHVGDSRAYVCREDLSVQLLTVDHTPKQPGERDRILAAGGTVVRGRLDGELAVSRALGDAAYRAHGLTAQSDVALAHLPHGSALLLVSDGALEALPAEQLCAMALGRRLHDFSTARPRPAASVAIPLPGAAHRAVDDSCPPPQLGLPDAGTHSASLAGALADAAVATDNAAVVVCRIAASAEELEGRLGSYLVLQPIQGQCSGSSALVRTDALLGFSWPDEFHEAVTRGIASGCAWLADDLLALPDGHTDAQACASIHQALLGLGVDSAQPDEGGFTLGSAIGHGGYGAVHRAVRSGSDTLYVMKHVPASASSAKLLAALREVHFGTLLPDSLFVESFHSGDDWWLVFRDGGTSLEALMYGTASRQGSEECGTAAAIVQPSAWWLHHRAAGNSTHLRDILAGVLRAVRDIHSMGVAHRDVKGANIVVREDAGAVTVSLVDYGSAVDEETLRGELYPRGSPSPAEETAAFAPPEARFGSATWNGRQSVAALHAYDLWSVGVVALQLLVTGTEEVFALPPDLATRTMRSAAAAGLSSDAAAVLIIIQGLAQLCITPHASSPTNASVVRAQQCSEARLLDVLRARDPTGRGLPPMGLRLVRNLLQWDPHRRVSAGRALQHAFFLGDGWSGIRCEDQREVEWADECPS
jgi:serine/threonine protein phosphatase PrpC/serine/threonine protein kinase